MITRRVNKTNIPKNELNGRDVVAEPYADKKTIAEYRQYPDKKLIKVARDTADGRKNLRDADKALWKTLKERGLLEETYGPKKKRKSKYGHLSDKELLKKVKASGAKIRRDLLHIDLPLHCELVRRKLMDEAFGPSNRKRKSPGS